MMPVMDGVDFLQRLRADPALRDIPVILLSARAGEEAQVEGLRTGADDYLTKPFGARELLARVATHVELARGRAQTASILRDEAHRLEILNRTAGVLAAEIDLEPLVQSVTDAATELTGAGFGAFFYNFTDDSGEAYLLYTLSGASREAFAGFPNPRNTALFAPTFSGEGIVRSGDIRKDPRYGRNAPNQGPPPGHLPVVSYLAVPVVAPNGASGGKSGGEVIGGIFLGHPEPDRFTEQHEAIAAGIAKQAALAFEKARLYEASRKAEAELRRREEQLRLATEAGEIGLWDFDLVTGDLFWQPRVKTMFGISPDAPVTRADFNSGLHPDDRDRVLACYEAATDPEQRGRLRCRVPRHRQGGRGGPLDRLEGARHLRRFGPLPADHRDGDGRHRAPARRGAAGAQRAGLSRAERDARTAGRRAHGGTRPAVAQLAGPAYLVVTSDGILQAVSPAVERTLGWSPEEMIGRPVFDFVVDEDLEGTREAVRMTPAPSQGPLTKTATSTRMAAIAGFPGSPLPRAGSSMAADATSPLKNATRRRSRKPRKPCVRRRKSRRSAG